jgi:hypothetical protein
LTLVRGLDAGDREIGIFNRHGLDVLQVYGLLADEYLEVPAALLGRPEAKQRLVREIAGDLLPDFELRREKARAQIGNAERAAGILPLLIDSGRDLAWIKKTFCELCGIRDPVLLNGFIRAGFYRFAGKFPARRDLDHDYFTE